ncbi:MAG: glycosyltransferase family 2 protein [Desulfobulbus sp.]|nr:glycosyltransferase family 2 protein [Desulfobulbus sp.]
MQTHPLVSVVIPAYNAQDFIADTLESIFAQTYPHVEVIVVDDGSTDGTAAVVQSFGKQVRYLYQANSGGCAVPRNAGMKLCTGKYLCFLDADDLMTPNRLADQVVFMERHPEIGLVFCDYINFDTAGRYPTTHFQTCPRLWPQLEDRQELILDQARSHLLEENFGIAGTLLMRATMLEKEPGFEPSLKACEDFHFYFRLARHSPVGIVNSVGMLRRFHDRNMSSSSFVMQAEGARSCTMLLDGESDSRVRQELIATIARYLTGLAYWYADHGQFREALQTDSKALVRDLRWPTVRRVGRNVARTLSMAIGLHKPK